MPSPPAQTNGPLRCVHYLRSLAREGGGIVPTVIDLCGALARRGHEVELIALEAPDVPAAWREGAAGLPRVVELGAAAGRGGRIGRSGLAAIEERLRSADVVHLHHPWDPGNLRIARRCRRLGRPYVVSLHGVLDDWSMAQKGWKKRAYLALGGRRFLERAAALHFTAEAERDQGLPRVPGAGDRAGVAPCVVDLRPYGELLDKTAARRRFEAPSGGMDERPTVLFLSRLHVKKGVDLLIDAAAILRDRGVDVRVLVAGPGEPAYVREMERRIAERGVGDRVELLGMVVGERKRALYRAADLFVLPTHQENFGLVLVEALASGTPVVTTRGTDIWREIEAAGGRVVERGASAIAGAVAEAVADRESLAELGLEGRAHVLDWLAEERVVGRYEALYRKALGGG